MNFAIVVAGGRGSRFGNLQPKQFQLLGGVPVLMHTLLAFEKSHTKPTLILALPDQERQTWASLCHLHHFVVEHQVCSGGTNRFESVKNAIQFITDNFGLAEQQGIVGVHDGVRPLVSSELIDRLYTEAGEKGAAIPCIPARESIRKLERDKSFSVNRNEYRLIQTPQCFSYRLIFQAYQQAAHTEFTDDAGVVESVGAPIHLVEGEQQNIKITYAEDLLIAEALLKSKRAGS